MTEGSGGGKSAGCFLESPNGKVTSVHGRSSVSYDRLFSSVGGAATTACAGTG